MRWMIVSSSLALAISLEMKKPRLAIAQSPGKLKEKNIQVSPHENRGGNGGEGGLSLANQRT